MKKTAEIYSQALVSLKGSKVLANLVMAIASDVHARSVVEYSESALFHYQYSSISQLFIRIGAGETKNVGSFIKSVAAFVLSWLCKVPDYAHHGVIRTALDCTPIKKPHSVCLEDRQFVYAVNETIAGNKPVEIGYFLSSLNIGFELKWSVPVSLERVKSHECAITKGHKQLVALVQSLVCLDKLVVNSADSGYGHAAFIAPMQAQKNLVNIVRFKTCNVWSSDPRTDTGGANGIYGQIYHLRRADAQTKYKNPKTGELAPAKPSICTRLADKTETYEITTRRGKVIQIHLSLYNNMMKRSEKGHNMKDKPFDLVIVEATNKQTGKVMFSKPIYLAVCGQRKSEISLRQAYEQHYAHRYDIEPNNRFIKQQLLLEKFATPIADHFDKWLAVICLAETLLLLTSSDLTAEQLKPKKKWHRTEPQTTISKTTTPQTTGVPITRPSIANTRKAAESLFLTFDPKPFLPSKSKKGNGRQQGAKMPPKLRYDVVRKTPKSTKKAQKTETAPVKETKS